MSDDMKTLGDEFPREMERVAELLKQYESIGISGLFGAAYMTQLLDRARAAQEHCDVVAMVQLYPLLQACA